MKRIEYLKHTGKLITPTGIYQLPFWLSVILYGLTTRMFMWYPILSELIIHYPGGYRVISLPKWTADQYWNWVLRKARR